MTLTLDAHENRDLMSADVPNAFNQTEMPEGQKGRRKSDDENHRSARGYVNSIEYTIIWASCCI